MPRPKSAVPAYRHHKSTGRAVVYVDRKSIFLGKYDSQESRQRYAEIVSKITSGQPVETSTKAVGREPVRRSISALCLRFIAAKVLRKEMQKSRREYNREFNPLADRVREANRAMLDHLHELLFDPLWVCGPDGFVNADGEPGHRRATDAESLQCSVEDYGEAFPVDLYGDIPAQVIAGLQERIKLHQAAIRRIRAAGKRGELVAVPVRRKAVK